MEPKSESSSSGSLSSSLTTFKTSTSTSTTRTTTSSKATQSTSFTTSSTTSSSTTSKTSSTTTSSRPSSTVTKPTASISPTSLSSALPAHSHTNDGGNRRHIGSTAAVETTRAFVSTESATAPATATAATARVLGSPIFFSYSRSIKRSSSHTLNAIPLTTAVTTETYVSAGTSALTDTGPTYSSTFPESTAYDTDKELSPYIVYTCVAIGLGAFIAILAASILSLSHNRAKGPRSILRRRAQRAPLRPPSAFNSSDLQWDERLAFKSAPRRNAQGACGMVILDEANTRSMHAVLAFPEVALTRPEKAASLEFMKRAQYGHLGKVVHARSGVVTPVYGGGDGMDNMVTRRAGGVYDGWAEQAAWPKVEDFHNDTSESFTTGERGKSLAVSLMEEDPEQLKCEGHSVASVPLYTPERSSVIF
ncbi:hypothetical protein BC830DRAFT_1097008, partial [Chytriomyces sp. MP71]